MSELPPFDIRFLVAFVVGFFVAIVAIGGLGRAPGFILPLFRLLGRVLRPIGRLFGKMRLFRRLRGKGRAARSAAAEGTAYVERGLGRETEIEVALRQAAGPSASGEVYDFSDEKRILQRGGTIFCSIRIPPEYLPGHLTGQLTDEIADQYLSEAKTFFHQSGQHQGQRKEPL